MAPLVSDQKILFPPLGYYVLHHELTGHNYYELNALALRFLPLCRCVFQYLYFLRGSVGCRSPPSDLDFQKFKSKRRKILWMKTIRNEEKINTIPIRLVQPMMDATGWLFRTVKAFDTTPATSHLYHQFALCRSRPQDGSVSCRAWEQQNDYGHLRQGEI